ncbi:transposase family protein [Rhodococcus cerastii]|nr:transposase family protein [Rhodococcus cerastii]
MDPAALTLTREGASALRDKYELVYRRQSQTPNQIWQVDHTELDIEILDPGGARVRPWLTVILDDCSRAVPGYTVGLGAPKDRAGGDRYPAASRGRGRGTESRPSDRCAERPAKPAYRVQSSIE